MNKRPRIGIPMRLEISTRRFYLGRDYSEAVEAMGAAPVHISLIPKQEYISAVMSELDGVLLPGSDSDIDPQRYGQEPHPKLGCVVPEKDETDLMMLAEAEKLKLSVLAICFGMQSLNVSRGGSLIQDIQTQVKNCVKHEQGVPRDRNSHQLKVDKASMLKILPSLAKPKVLISVNSHHHQAIEKVGKNLKATAWAGDGVIEFVEDTRKDRFVIGVQWHPELSWKKDRLSHDIFESFVFECRKRAK